MPITLLGDPAYPLKTWLQKPFPDNGRLTQEQRLYNFYLSSARMVIENTFGRCKGRWRILLKRIDMSTEEVTTIVLACFTLHNVCEIHKEEFNHEWVEVVQNEALHQPIDFQGNEGEMGGRADEVRRAIVDFFSNQQ